MTRNTRQTAQESWTKVSTQSQFNLYRSTVDPLRWQVRLRGSGGYIRRRFNAPDLASALTEALRATGLLPTDPGQSTVTLDEAFELTLACTDRREKSRTDWLRTLERFMRWLKKHHPLCTQWRQMTRPIIREYLCTFKDRAANTKRLALQPILQTAGFMHREYGFPNIGERLGIGAKLKTTPKSVYLEDVLSFCNWVRDHRPHLEAGACLQGLAGLQFLEALRLTWDKVDLETGLIEISGEVKNLYRNRVIPVAARVLEALKRAKAEKDAAHAEAGRGKVIPITAHVVTGLRGEGFEDPCSYSRQMRAAMRAWNPLCEWTPKDLRNCLPTFAATQGLQGTMWEQYIGHAPRTITERHYVPRLASRTDGERSALRHQMDLFRRLVLEPLETASKPAVVCNILQSGVSEPESEKSYVV